ncbi:MAG: hypothetical protein ACJKTH_02560 [Patescibacteria group bacterium UBA2163]
MFYASVLALLFTALTVFGWGLSVEAFINDSEIVEINEPGPDAPPPENTVQVGVDTTNNSSLNNSEEGDDSGNETLSLDNSGATTTITFSEDTQEQENDTSTQTSVTTEVSITTETETSASGDASSGGSGGTTSTTETTVSDPASVIASLIGSGAVLFLGGGSVEGGSGNNGTFTDSTVRIDAARARASFKVQRITQLSLSGVEAVIRGREGNVTQRFNENDFALFVSSKLLQDEYIDDVALTGHTVDIEYRALGRLFGIFPLRYVMNVSVDFNDADSVLVDIRFPWYKFFLASGVSSTELERVLIAEVKNNISLQSEDVFGVATQVFAAVIETLQTYLDV